MFGVHRNRGLASFCVGTFCIQCDGCPFQQFKVLNKFGKGSITHYVTLLGGGGPVTCYEASRKIRGEVVPLH